MKLKVDFFLIVILLSLFIASASGVPAIVWPDTSLPFVPPPPPLLPNDIGDTVTMDLGSMISYYPMNHDIHDYSGNNLHGTLYGPDPSPDPPCASLDSSYTFMGNGDYIELPHSNLYNTLPITVSFWFKKNNNFIQDTPGWSDIEGLMTKSVNTGLDQAYTFILEHMTPPFRVVAQIGNGATLQSIGTGYVIQPYTWYHLACILRNTKLVLFLNGDPVDSVSITPPPPVINSNPFLLGEVPFNLSQYRWFVGNMDEIRFYPRALSYCEIKYLYEPCHPLFLDASMVPASICSYDTAAVHIINPQAGIQYQLVDAVTHNPAGPVMMASPCNPQLTLASLTALAPGTYSYQVQAFNPLNAAGIYLDTTFILTVISGPPINIGHDTSLCGAQTLSLQPGSGYVSYLWQDGSTSATYQVNAPGTYWVRVLNAAGCYASDTVHVTYMTNIQIQHNFAICQGDSLFAGAQYQHTSGIYHDTIHSTSLCDTINTTNLTVNSIPALSLNPDRMICHGDTVMLDALNPGSSYHWSNGLTSRVIVVNQAGTFIVTVTNAAGCTNQDTCVVTLWPDPVISVFPADPEICADSALLLTASGAAGYAWDPPAGLSSTLGASVTASPAASIHYQVTGTSAQGCKGEASVYVHVIPLPSSQLAGEIYFCKGYSIDLDPGFCDSCYYHWANGMNTRMITVEETGTYTLVISNHSCRLIDTIRVKECMEIWVPNAFSPNGDARNDFFRPVGINIEEYEMYIFNRWGSQIFYTHDLNTGWDGNYKGAESPAGVYFYLIYYRGHRLAHTIVNSKKAGTFTLIR